MTTYVRYPLTTWLLSVTCLLLAGCAQQLPSRPTVANDFPQWLAHQQQVANIQQFQTQGAFAYRDGLQAMAAHFYWQQTDPQHYQLLLNSALGSKLFKLIGDGQQVTIIDDQNQQYQGDNAEQLIYRLTGMPIPFQQLQQWILGAPGDSRHYQVDDRYLLQQASFGDGKQRWTVNYLDYTQQDGVMLPQQLWLKQGRQTIKLKMNRWDLHNDKG